MKILNGRTGAPQTVPFDLGEAGRGRHLERVEVSNRPGQAPVGPQVGPPVEVPPYPMYGTAGYEEQLAAYQAASAAAEAQRQRVESHAYDVGYFTIKGGDGRSHVILTSPRPGQTGIMVRVNTRGAYTKGSSGSISSFWGKAEEVAKGQWAEGDAGRVACGPDALWHVTSPAAFFRVYVQGGERKGGGWFCLVVLTREGRTWFGRTDELAQIVATDDDPAIAEVARSVVTDLADSPPEGEWFATMRAAVETAQRLEDSAGAAEAQAAGIEHYFLGDPPDWAALLPSMSPPLAIPGGRTAPEGVDRVESGTLLPGPCSLVFLATAGGGKRYRHSEIRAHGVEVVARGGYDGRGYYSAFESILGIVTDPETFQVEWEEFKDGAEVARVRADKDGVTYTYADGTRETRAWG